MGMSWVDYLIVGIYFCFVLGIGWVVKKSVKNSGDFLMSGRSIPLWISSLAFISANLGAQEVIGMAASGAKYGLMTAHFYWLGAIPAMVFLGVFMMPFYYGSRARSVPEYLSLRFDEKTRAVNAFSFAAMTIFSSGVSLYALALLLQTILGWQFESSILLSAGIVFIYTFLGGLTSAIYNEVLQFFLIVLGISPIVYIGLHLLGGYERMTTRLPEVMSHTWKYADVAANNPMGVGSFELIFGLGVVLSFGYWCTDFLVVQRAMVTKDMSAAQRTPIIAAIPKLLLPLVVILPGMIALALTKDGTSFHLPLKADGRVDFDMTLPSLLTHFFPPGLLGVGVTALMASFMSGMAGNVTAFNTVWTYDIYQAYVKKDASDAHYFTVARWATVVGILLSVATAYLARSFNNIMDLLQLIFGFVNAPLFATFLLGMFWKRTTGHGAFWGLLSGTTAAALTHGLTVAEGKGGWISNVHEYPSAMGQAFNIAIIAWVTCLLVTIGISLFTVPKTDDQMRGLVYSLTPKQQTGHLPFWKRPMVLGGGVLFLTLVINYIFS